MNEQASTADATPASDSENQQPEDSQVYDTDTLPAGSATLSCCMCTVQNLRPGLSLSALAHMLPLCLEYHPISATL